MNNVGEFFVGESWFPRQSLNDMASSLLILVCLSAVLSASLVQSQLGVTESKIIAGKTIHIENAPFLVQVTYLRTNPDYNYCGGSLITVNHVLTAGHCIGQHVSHVRVYVGSDDFANPWRNNTAKEYRARSQQVHENYRHKTLPSGQDSAVYDIGVIRLATPVQLGPKLATIAYVKANQQPPAGSKVVVAGWGMYRVDQTLLSTTPRSTSLTVLTEAACRKVYNDVLTPQEFCTEASLRGASCFGDFGAAAVIGKLLYGVSSFGNCGEEVPDVYANLADPSMNNFVSRMVATL